MSQSSVFFKDCVRYFFYSWLILSSIFLEKILLLHKILLFNSSEFISIKHYLTILRNELLFLYMFDICARYIQIYKIINHRSLY